VKARIRSSITLKMALLVLGGTSIVFALLLTYSYYYSREIILGEAEKNARNLSLSVARRIEQEFRAVAKVPENFAGYLQTHHCDERTLLKLIRWVVTGNREVFGSAVAFAPSAFGEGVKSFAPYFFKGEDGINYEQLSTTAGYYMADWYHIPKVLKAPVWTEPYFDEGGAEIVMTTYSYPLFGLSEDGGPPKFRAIITADISLEWLTDLVGSIRVGRTGFCFIVSDTGRIVTYPRPELIMRESMFSLAEELHDPKLRKIGRAMIREHSGFFDLGSSLTGNDSFLAYARIPSPGWSLGAIFPKKELFAEVEALYERTLLLALVVLPLLLGVSLLVAGSIARPLRRMAAATSRVAEGDLGVDLSDIRSTDEVGQLARGFMRMTEGLKDRDRIRDTFGRYVTQEVVKRLLESKDGLKLGGENREISLIMSDLRGFTALTAHMRPEQVIKFLNRYLGKMVEILMDHRGIIDEIIGDGILAFFGAPEPLDDHPAVAVACAVKMQAAMDEINELNEADGLPHLEMGVAVNTGEVVVGNIGSERRTKYGAVGAQVNFTGRVESFTVGGQVLISQSTYEGLADILDVRDVLKVEMKGVPGTVSLYDVRGIVGPYEARLPERDHTPVPLGQRINIQIYRLDEKVLNGEGTTGWMTHVSLSSAVIISSDALGQWQDIRILLVEEQMDETPSEVYGKVVSIEKTGSEYEAVVRFTSVSPEAYKVFRAARQI